MAELEALVPGVDLTEIEERVLAYYCWIREPEMSLAYRMCAVDADEWKAAVDRLLDLGFVTMSGDGEGAVH